MSSENHSNATVRTSHALAAPGAPHALLVVLPGAFLSATDYTALLDALQASAPLSLSLWTAVAELDWCAALAAGPDHAQQVAGMVEAAVQRAVDAATAQGFEPLRSSENSVQLENLFIAMHSASAAWATIPAVRQQAAGVIFLASGLVPQPSVCPGLQEYPRPAMHIFGQLDGQFSVGKGALIALEAVAAAVKLGPRHMAQCRPIVVIPGTNHGHFSNGVANTARGDLAAEVAQGPCLQEVAGHMLRFMEANHPGAVPEVAAAAVEQLLTATEAGFDLLSPYTAALGRGSLVALLHSNPKGEAACLADAAPSLLAAGAEALPFSFPSKAFAAHPGELGAAEKFFQEAQLRMLSQGLPESLVNCVQVAATVHTSLEAFHCSQPKAVLAKAAADSGQGVAVAVHVHCYLHRECLGLTPDAYHKPQAPQYFLKLLTPEAISRAARLVVEDFLESGLQGCELNQELYEQALKEAHALALCTFQKRGRQLVFAPDRAVNSYTEWVATPAALEHDPASQVTSMVCPAASLPATQRPQQAAATADAVQFRSGSVLCIKCASLAWMHEWLLVTGLRPPAQ